MLFVSKRTISLLLSLVILITCANIGVNATDSENVTIIKTVGQLNAIRNNIDENGKIYGNYRLGADIVFNEGETFSPIGCSSSGGVSAAFIGEFDGDGYTIKNIMLKSNATSHSTLYLGLFSSNNGTIKNLIMENANMVVTKCNYLSAGSIAGTMYSSDGRGKILNCFVKGEISLQNPSVAVYTRMGGIVGTVTSGATVNKVLSNVNIKYESKNSESIMLGGIAGENGGKIFGCGNNGNIDALSKNGVYAGGIAGCIVGTASVIQDCFNTAKIKAESDMSMCLGGIAGSIGEASGITTKILYNCNAGKISPKANFSGGAFTSQMASIASGAIIGSFKGESRDNYYLEDTYSVASTKGQINASEVTVEEMRNASLDKISTWYLPSDNNSIPQLQAWKNIQQLDVDFTREIDKLYRTVDINTHLLAQAIYDDGTSETIERATVTHLPIAFGENTASISWRGESSEVTFNGYYAGDTDFNTVVSVTDIICSLEAVTSEKDIGIGIVAADVDKNSVLNVTDIVITRKMILEND